MPQPIHRYSDERAKLIDGALFIFAYSTNPEILLAVECRREDDSQQAWYYGFARLSTAGLSVSLDGREVWAKAWPPPERMLHKPYMSFTKPILTNQPTVPVF